MLQASHLNYKHKNHQILKDLDFSCNSGQFVSILGPNGAGKSTLLSLLANEYREKGVKIFFKSKEYETWCTNELPKHKAKFSQHNNSDIPLKVCDVVMMGRYPYFENNPSEKDQKAIQECMQCTDVCPLQDREYNQLSGGEKQRVHLARVLAQLENTLDEKIIFLDEPLNNLDVLHQHKILKLLKDFSKRGNSVIVVLHDLNLAAQFSDKILLMKDGEKVGYDTPNNILTQEIISTVYNFPCTVSMNPINNNPLIIFG